MSTTLDPVRPRRRGDALVAALREDARVESVVLLTAPVIALAALAWHQRWISDDGLINVRVIHNLFSGAGPVFNVGERVEVGTSTLWLALLALGHLVLPGLDVGHVAVAEGLCCSVLALALSTVASARLWHVLGRRGRVLPLGSVVVVALPPFWDFATSGLETGLTFLWLAGSYLLLVERLARSVGVPQADNADGRAPRIPWWPAFVIGLGPLVRPDLGLVAVVLWVALLTLARRGLRSWAGCLLAAGAVPAAYEVFRAGYYGALVPNTALAKDAGSSLWGHGRAYLRDYAGTYRLVVPLLALLLLVWGPALAGVVRRRQLPAATVLAAPVVAGLLHALYVVRVGGDFMHGRFLLPATFCLLLPVMTAVPEAALSSRLLVGATALVVLPWALVVAAVVRLPYPGIGPAGIADEHGYYVSESHVRHPTSAAAYDYPGSVLDAQTAPYLALAGTGATGLYDGTHRYPPAPGYGLVVRWTSMGGFGVVTGPRVFVDDELSLTTPFGSRLAIPVTPTSRIGHSQVAPLEWSIARYAAPGPDDTDAVRDARAALACPDLVRLDRAVRAPLSVGRFLSNLRASVALTRLRIPVDPAAARAAFCGT